VVAETASTVARLAVAELAAATVDAARTVVAELKVLHDNNTSSSVSTDGGTDDELKRVREAAREQVAQGVAAHPQGRGGGSPDGRGCADGALGWGTCGGHAPDDSGSPDRRGRTDG
jgi:hypothetical protein